MGVLQGRPEAEIRAVARCAFLPRHARSAGSPGHQRTGYLPITRAAYEQSRSIGFYDRSRGTDISIKQMTLNSGDGELRGLRPPTWSSATPSRRSWKPPLSGRKAAKAALDDAVRRGNDILRVTRIQPARPPRGIRRPAKV